MASRGIASLRTWALLRNPERAELDVPLDFPGFDSNDVRRAGYQLEWAERYRTLPDIRVVQPDS